MKLAVDDLRRRAPQTPIPLCEDGPPIVPCPDELCCFADAIQHLVANGVSAAAVARARSVVIGDRRFRRGRPGFEKVGVGPMVVQRRMGRRKV